jgi:hypothetical protein
MSRARTIADILTAASTLATDTETAAAISTHAGLADPHTGYLLESLFDTKGDLLVASADNTPAKLPAGTNGYLLTANSGATNGIEWAAAPVSLPSQTGNGGEYLTTDGSTASWAAITTDPSPTAFMLMGA